MPQLISFQLGKGKDHRQGVAAVKSLPCRCCLELQTHQDTQAAAGWFPAQAAQETLGEGGLRAALGKELKEKDA